MKPLVDPAAERYVLGAVMLWDGVLAEVRDLVGEDDFDDPCHASIFGALVAVDAMPDGRISRHISIPALKGELLRRGCFNAVGGTQYLGALTDADDFDGMPPTPGGAPRAARRVSDLAQRRRIVEAARDAALRATAGADDGVDVSELLEATLSTLSRISAEGVRGHTGRTFNEALQALLTRDRDAEPVAWRLPWPTLDAALGGLRRKRLVVIAARPAVGKSAFALNLALSLSAPSEWERGSRAKPAPVLFFALEMGDEELAARGAASLARINANRIESGALKGDLNDPASEFAQVVRVAQGTVSAPLRIDDTTTSVARMRLLAADFVRRNGPCVVVIDYLQLCSSKGLDVEKGANRERHVAEMSKALKHLAKDLDVCVVLLAQLNRGKSDEEKPDLRALRESGAIEQDADAVVFLYGPRPGEGSLTREVHAYCAKVRGGAGETDVTMVYHRAHTRFEEDPDAFRALPIEDRPTTRTHDDESSDEDTSFRPSRAIDSPPNYQEPDHEREAS